MVVNIGGRLKHAWNAFTGRTDELRMDYIPIANYGSRPDRVRMTFSGEKTFISSIYTRIAIDVAAITMKHMRVNENEQYVETINSGLNNCLTVEANIDQAARAFMQDLVLTMLDKGVIAVVPVDTTINPTVSGSYDIQTLRVGTIVQWFPEHVKVNLYNTKTARREDIVVEKKHTAIIQNPLYEVMNEPNSTLSRLIRKLSLLDAVDEASNAGKLDIIIQLPYAVKSETRQQQAEQRREAIEQQLSGARTGIAYIDGTEKITQLNRPAENNLMSQIEYLTDMAYAQLGLTKSVFDGTADEKTMVNYHNRTLEPILTAIAQGFTRTFLTKTARTQLQVIGFFRNPFSLVATADLAEIVDKFTRNEILSSNEVRGIIGFAPSSDAKADELRNKNIPEPDPQVESMRQPPKAVAIPPVELKKIEAAPKQSEN